MGLFDKKTCYRCGDKAGGIFSREKLSDGSYICSNCQALASQYLRNWGSMTPEQVDEKIALKEQNKELSSAFTCSTSDSKNLLLIDTKHQWWCIAKGRDYQAGNVDVFGFEQFASAQPIIDWDEREDNNVIRQVISDIKLTINVHHPYVNKIELDLLGYADETEAARGVQHLNELLNLFATVIAGQGAAEQQAPAMDGLSSADALLKYKELLDAGAISQAEFNRMKKQIMG